MDRIDELWAQVNTQAEDIEALRKRVRDLEENLDRKVDKPYER